MLTLPPTEYHRIVASLRELPINTIFARLVVERQTPGRVFVDDLESPRACYVALPYGMSLLFGSTASESFRQALLPYLLGLTCRRSSQEWLQVFPNDWALVLEEMLGSRLQADSGAAVAAVADGRVVQNTRVNFLFNPERHAALRKSLSIPPDCEIIDDAEYLFANMKGSVVPNVFWNSAGEFRERSAGFGVSWRGELAATAFGAFRLDDDLELGIETFDRFRGRGFAIHACNALIDHCVERRLEPVWACRLANAASYRLAIKLGFDATREIPYYQLPLSPAEN
jgi:hypothetical protein